MATIDNYTININVKGDADLKNATQSADNLSKKLDNMGSSSGAINQFNNKLKQGSENLSHTTERMNLLKESSEKLLVAFVGLGAIEFVKKLLETADATDKTANAFGLSIERTLELQAAFQKIGVEGNGMARTMTTVADAMVKLQHGDLDTIATFKQLGLTYDDLKGKSPDQQLVMITKAAADSAKTVEDLTAAHTLLGKKMTGKDLKEFNDTLQAVTGTMAGAAESTRNLKQVQDNLEMSAIKIKTAFLELITPVAEFFAKFSSEGDHSKEIAIAMATALAAIGGTLVISGINAVIGAVSTLTAYMTGLFAVETGGVAVTTSLTAAETALLRVQAASAVARAESLAAIVAEQTARIESLATMEADVVVTAQLTAAKRALMLASGQLALAQGTAAGATAGLAAAEGAATVATVTLTGVMAPLLAAAGTLLTVFLALEAVNLLTKNEQGKGWWDQAAEGLEKLVRTATPGLADTLERIGKALGMAPGAGSQPVNTGSGFRTPGMGPQAVAGAGIDVVGGGGAASAEQKGKAQLDQLAKLRVEQQNQLSILKEQQNIDVRRYENALKLIGVSQVEKATEEAKFSSIEKSTQEIFNLQNQIRVKQAEVANTPAGSAQAQAQTELAGLQQRLKFVKENTNAQAELAGQQAKNLELARQANAIAIFGRDLEYKKTDELYTLQQDINALTMTNDEKRMASVQQLINAETTAEIRRREAMLKPGESLGFEEQISIINQVSLAMDPLIEKNKELIAISREFSTGWNAAYKQYIDDSSNAAKRGGDAFNAFTTNTNSAIDNFVSTGKFSFEDFARSIIQDLIKIELKAEASQLIKGLFGSGGVMGFLGDIFRADGGPVAGNKPYIVGEKGPELFVPQGAGSIVPNGAAIGGAGGGNSAPTNVVNNVYNVSAIDSRSVASFFAENRKTMLGTMQLAQKELPYSNR